MSTLAGASNMTQLLFQGAARVVNVKFCVGDGSFTEDMLKEEFAVALRQRSAGSAVVSERFNDDAPKFDVRSLVATLQD